MWRASSSSLAGAPESVALYITQLAKKRRVATVQRRLAAISQAHQNAGHATPTEDRLVRKTMSGIRRTLGVAPLRKAPTRTKLLRELVALDRADVSLDPDGARITIRASKTD